jgi:prophage regulatory protein
MSNDRKEFPRVLGRAQLVDWGITYTNTHLLRLEKECQFPRRVPLGANRVAWVETEIDEWLRERIAGRDNPRPPHDDGPQDGAPL